MIFFLCVCSMAHSLRSTTTIGSTIGPNPLSCLESWWNFKASLAAIYSNHDKSLCRNLTTFYLLPPHHTKAKGWSHHSGFFWDFLAPLLISLIYSSTYLFFTFCHCCIQYECCWNVPVSFIFQEKDFLENFGTNHFHLCWFFSIDHILCVSHLP